ncbi:hypothetical protein CROQUDRAFT_663210 [Cronartium quercuum f. sp. fusiforme G11]|uniref:Uncharacterized protein n=1 Tax=Cronartium quercuum f. sp. fusiforme G11 TaxID=708437 RepID=A0A9P6T7G3_9BASI|nr:hypothetical protein CROQUDRAFT_663210 [Cronartium quercuum f. sp. fusiforme G11]
MAILNFTPRLGSTTQTEGSSNKKESAQPNSSLPEQVLSCKSFTCLRQTSAVPSQTNWDSIELSRSLSSPVFLLQCGSNVSGHPQPQSASPTDKATEGCSPAEGEFTTDFEDDNSFSLYYDCETNITVSSSSMMGEQDSANQSIESQQNSGSRLTALRDLTEDHPPSYSRTQLTQLLNNTRFDIGLEDSFEKLEPVVPIPSCEILNLNTQSLKSSQKSSSSETTLNSSSESSKRVIQSETSSSLVEDHARSSGCLVFDHLKILLSQLDIPDNDSPKYHVAWAFDGRFTKPKPSAAFDSIAFEVKQMENYSTMPGENIKKKIELLKTQRKSKFLAKLPSIEINQVPKFIKNISKTPSWAVIKPVGTTASVTFETANALLS